MKYLHKAKRLEDIKTDKTDFNNKMELKLQKKEKFFSIGIYVLIMIITIALMLILFNVI